jgi:uncharacterized membrane protein
VIPTIVFTVALLLVDTGSGTTELTFAVSEMTVPFAVPAFTLTTTVNTAGAEGARSALVQTSVPVPPGVLQAHPVGAVTL